MLRTLDISGNATDISIINALRCVLESNTTLRNLSISNLHKVNPGSQSIIINSFAKNKGLKNLNLKRTTEIFYYALREKMIEREESENEVPSIKISFTKFVQDFSSSDKKDKENDENSNRLNMKEKVRDYSAKVRLLNKEKFQPLRKKDNSLSDSEGETGIVPAKTFSHHMDEESDMSELTDDCMTSYRKFKDQQCSYRTYAPIKPFHKANKSVEFEEPNKTFQKDTSLQYSLTSLGAEDDEEEEDAKEAEVIPEGNVEPTYSSDSDSSLEYYYNHKLTYYRKAGAIPTESSQSDTHRKI